MRFDEPPSFIYAGGEFDENVGGAGLSRRLGALIGSTVETGVNLPVFSALTPYGAPVVVSFCFAVSLRQQTPPNSSGYRDRWLMFGEDNAVRWFLNKYGQR
jgi:hypothetical protein